MYVGELSQTAEGHETGGAVITLHCSAIKTIKVMFVESRCPRLNTGAPEAWATTTEAKPVASIHPIREVHDWWGQSWASTPGGSGHQQGAAGVLETNGLEDLQSLS